MKKYNIIKIKDNKELIENAAKWFNEKWGIPSQAYIDSMNESINNKTSVPQWYVVLHKKNIIAGLGVIENDFHNRIDLSPNICSVYVDNNHRKQGLAGNMLNFVCNDLKSMGINNLYLVTNHTSFYEKYNWEFLCMVESDDEKEMSRMYIHKS